MRTAPLLPGLALVSLALAGCITDGLDGLPGAARPSDEARQAQASASAAAPHKPKKKAWWEEGPVTRAKASSMCWMKVERRRDLALERRADLVNRCVAAEMKKHARR